MHKPYLVVGLGNPGTKYAGTRHNAGFMVLDRLANRWRADWKTEKDFQSRMARVDLGERRVHLCQPQTFMNASGEAVAPVRAYYRIGLDELLVLVDDADLPLGTLRLRRGGSSGGHHGLDSLETNLGTQDYARLRIGIGRTVTAERQIRDYVLSRFQPAEMGLVEKVLERAADQVTCWLTDGIEKAMNNFNGIVETTEKDN